MLRAVFRRRHDDSSGGGGIAEDLLAIKAPSLAEEKSSIRTRFDSRAYDKALEKVNKILSEINYKKDSWSKIARIREDLQSRFSAKDLVEKLWVDCLPKKESTNKDFSKAAAEILADLDRDILKSFLKEQIYSLSQSRSSQALHAIELVIAKVNYSRLPNSGQVAKELRNELAKRVLQLYPCLVSDLNSLPESELKNPNNPLRSFKLKCSPLLRTGLGNLEGLDIAPAEILSLRTTLKGSDAESLLEQHIRRLAFADKGAKSTEALAILIADPDNLIHEIISDPATMFRRFEEPKQYFATLENYLKYLSNYYKKELPLDSFENKCTSEYDRYQFLNCEIQDIYDWLVLKATSPGMKRDPVAIWARQVVLNNDGWTTPAPFLDYIKRHVANDRTSFPSKEQEIYLHHTAKQSGYIDPFHMEIGLHYSIFKRICDTGQDFFANGSYVHRLSASCLAVSENEIQQLSKSGFKFGEKVPYLPNFRKVEYPEGWKHYGETSDDNKGSEVYLCDKDSLRRYRLEYRGGMDLFSATPFKSALVEESSALRHDQIADLSLIKEISDLFRGNDRSHVVFASPDGRFAEIGMITPGRRKNSYLLNFGYGEFEFTIASLGLKGLRCRLLTQQEEAGLPVRSIYSNKGPFPGFTADDLDKVWRLGKNSLPESRDYIGYDLANYFGRIADFKRVREAMSKQNFAEPYQVS